MRKPVYQHIRDWRVVQTGVIVFLSYILWMLTAWMVSAPFGELQTWHLVPITTAFPALIGGLFAIVNSLLKRHEKEED